ncbi:hypothetical protein [Shewanella algae]|uniref:hypothetical protein n=1 Tax=Shewanella algae TaxID=38313 RepID=UPI0031F4CAAE
MDWKSAKKNDQGLLEVPKSWLHSHYYEALNILFRFENSLRVFVYVVLKSQLNEKWSEASFSMGQANAQSIKGVASKRIKQADSFGYLGYDITAPLMHLTSGELVEIITCDAYWPIFKGFFRGNKELIKNKLLEIGTIRNSLAHFRPIKSDDIELIKQNSRHTLIGVERCLSNLFSQRIRVPTNTDEEWYKSISTIGTEYISTILYHSEDEQWINIQLKFTSPILSKQELTNTFYSYNLAKLITPNILKESDIISKYITYISEYISYPSIDDKWDIHFSKDVNFVFDKKVLIENASDISDAIRGIVSLTTEECELLQNDHLARGKILKSENVSAYWSQPEDSKGSWTYHHDRLTVPYEPLHPDEYWGQKLYNSSDVVASSRRYPWMPDDISDQELLW